MPAGYAATTGVESFAGDDFAFELSDLRVGERMPSAFPGMPGAPSDIYLEPANSLVQDTVPPGKASRRPSNILPLQDYDHFYLGLDVTFVGTQLGQQGYPRNVSLEVSFFLEGYGVAEDGTTAERHEINITPQRFENLNADPNSPGAGQGILRHQLWVQVAKSNLGGIIQAPTNQPWNELFTPGTVYEIAASVRTVGCKMIPLDCPCIAGFLKGAVMNTYDCPTPDPDLPSDVVVV